MERGQVTALQSPRWRPRLRLASKRFARCKHDGNCSLWLLFAAESHIIWYTNDSAPSICTFGLQLLVKTQEISICTLFSKDRQQCDTISLKNCIFFPSHWPMEAHYCLVGFCHTSQDLSKNSLLNHLTCYCQLTSHTHTHTFSSSLMTVATSKRYKTRRQQECKWNAQIFQCVGKRKKAHIRCVCVCNGEMLAAFSQAYAPEERLYNMCNH